MLISARIVRCQLECAIESARLGLWGEANFFREAGRRRLEQIHNLLAPEVASALDECARRVQRTLEQLEAQKARPPLTRLCR